MTYETEMTNKLLKILFWYSSSNQILTCNLYQPYQRTLLAKCRTNIELSTSSIDFIISFFLSGYALTCYRCLQNCEDLENSDLQECKPNDNFCIKTILNGGEYFFVLQNVIWDMKDKIWRKNRGRQKKMQI